MLRHYVNRAPTGQALTIGIDGDDIELQISSTNGFPTEFPFIVTIERGTPSEEVALCTAADADTLTVVRGYDNTPAVSHNIGARVEHTTTAIDYREAGIVRIDEAERDALAAENLWAGRLVFNTDRESYDFWHPSSVWVGIIPSGLIAPFGGAVAPAGWRLCNGQALSRTTPDTAGLFAAIGTAYGVGDGSTTFNVPDLRGRFPLGKADAGTGSALGESGGSLDHIHAGPSHSHSAPSHDHGNGSLSASSAGSHNHSVNPPSSSTNNAGSHSHSQGSTGNTSLNESTGTANVGSTVTRQSGGSSTLSADHTHTLQGLHFHNLSSTNSGGSHNHSFNMSAFNSNSGGSHGHSITGTTASASGGNTGLAGSAPTDSANPPFQAVNYIIKL